MKKPELVILWMNSTYRDTKHMVYPMLARVTDKCYICEKDSPEGADYYLRKGNRYHKDDVKTGSEYGSLFLTREDAIANAIKRIRNNIKRYEESLVEEQQKLATAMKLKDQRPLDI